MRPILKEALLSCAACWLPTTVFSQLLRVSLTVSAGQQYRRGGGEPSSGSPTTGVVSAGCISSGGSAGAGGLPGSSGQFPELLSLQSRAGAILPVSAGWVVPVLP